jgi:hypothetical protein
VVGIPIVDRVVGADDCLLVDVVEWNASAGEIIETTIPAITKTETTNDMCFDNEPCILAICFVLDMLFLARKVARYALCPYYSSNE